MVLTPEDIINECCKEGNISLHLFYSNTKKRSVIVCKQMAAKIIKDKLNLSYADIGVILCGKDRKSYHHTTIMHSYNTISGLMDVNDAKIVKAYTRICERLSLMQNMLIINVSLPNREDAINFITKTKEHFPEAKVDIKY
jgi:chromosomal replication initiation ATPase DnaA